MNIPDLSKSANTEPSFPPRLTRLSPRRSKTGTSNLWSCLLEWDCNALTQPDGEASGDLLHVTFPPQFPRAPILAAFSDHGPAYEQKIRYERKASISLNVIVGGVGDGIPVLDQVPGLVRAVGIQVAEGSCVVRAIVVVELGRNGSNDICDLLDADVHLKLTEQEELPLGAGADPKLDEAADARAARRRARAENGAATP